MKTLLGWVAVGLVVLVSACGAPGVKVESLEAGAEQTITGEAKSMTLIATKVETAAEATPTQNVAAETPTAVVEVAATEALPASTESPESTVPASPTSVEMAPTEAPVATVAATPTEAAVVSTVTPILEADSIHEEVAQAQTNTNPGPSEEQLRLLASLNNYGPAPQWHNDVWLNSEPLTLADLRGKVVMVEFWTFG